MSGATLGLVLLGITMALVLSEAAYRVRLYFVGQPHRFVRGAANGFSVIDRPMWIYDEQFGYVYPKGERIHFTHITKGRVVACSFWTGFNEQGNIGVVEGDYATADLKILVFGDSFTATVYDGIGWPLLLQRRLSQRLRRTVHVVNFGRDGYGILQMFDLAAAKIPEWKPHLAILAFITDDLQRRRFWRTVANINGRWRYLVSPDPTPTPDLARAYDIALYHPEATSNWCQSMKGTDSRDRVLDEIVEVYKLGRGTGETRTENILTLRHSYLLARVKHRDPFRGLPGASSFPKIDHATYADDARFVEGLRAIEATGVPYVVVHLPRYEELKEGREYLLDDQQGALLRSLAEVTGKRVLETTQHIRLPVEQPERLIKSPDDHHPALPSFHLYAEAVAEMLVRNGLVR
jgi:hypothetical protein